MHTERQKEFISGIDSSAKLCCGGVHSNNVLQCLSSLPPGGAIAGHFIPVFHLLVNSWFQVTENTEQLGLGVASRQLASAHTQSTLFFLLQPHYVIWNLGKTNHSANFPGSAPSLLLCCSPAVSVPFITLCAAVWQKLVGIPPLPPIARLPSLLFASLKLHHRHYLILQRSLNTLTAMLP